MSSLSERVKNIQKAKEAVDLEKTRNEYHQMSLEDLGQVSLKHGAHAGKTFDWVWENKSDYVAWCAGHLRNDHKWGAFLMYIDRKTTAAEAELKMKPKGYPKTVKDTTPFVPEEGLSDDDSGWSAIHSDMVKEKSQGSQENMEIKETLKQVTEAMGMMMSRLSSLEGVTQHLAQHLSPPQ